MPQLTLLGGMLMTYWVYRPLFSYPPMWNHSHRTYTTHLRHTLCDTTNPRLFQFPFLVLSHDDEGGFHILCFFHNQFGDIVGIYAANDHVKHKWDFVCYECACKAVFNKVFRVFNLLEFGVAVGRKVNTHPNVNHLRFWDNVKEVKDVTLAVDAYSKAN